MRSERGLSLLEVLVAVAVLATGVVAMQRLLVRSVGGLADDAELTHTMLVARTLLAEAEASMPEPGRVAGEVAAAPGFRFERVVERTPHAALRELRVRVYRSGHERTACELVELVRVPTS